MSNNKTWDDADTVQSKMGQTTPGVVYVVDPTTNKAVSPSGGGGGGGAVTVADGADTAQGTTTDAAVTNPATAATLVAVLKGLLTNTADLLADGDFLTTIATNTTAIATSAKQDAGNTSLASIKTDLDSLVTNTADLLADGDFLTTIATNTANIPAKGAAATSASTPVNVASDQVVPVKRSAVAIYSLASTAITTTPLNSGDLVVGAYTEIGIDLNSTAQTGTSPTIQFFWERKGADGIYYILWQTAIWTAATNTASASIGAGMNYNEHLGITGRLRWVIGGSATPGYTISANVYGK